MKYMYFDQLSQSVFQLGVGNSGHNNLLIEN